MLDQSFINCYPGLNYLNTGVYMSNVIGSNNPNFIHGLSSKKNIHPLYKKWKTIKERCYSVGDASISFKHYRFKKILMCEDWYNNPLAFYTWAILNGWKEGLCIDRIDPNGNYEPNNCQFLTRSENSKKTWKDNPKLGEKTVNAKLTSEQVTNIRNRLKNGEIAYRLSKEYNVDRSTIYDIRDRKIWKHLEENNASCFTA